MTPWQFHAFLAFISYTLSLGRNPYLDSAQLRKSIHHHLKVFTNLLLYYQSSKKYPEYFFWSLKDLNNEEWFAISAHSPKFASNFRNEICKLPVEFQ